MKQADCPNTTSRMNQGLVTLSAVIALSLTLTLRGGPAHAGTFSPSLTQTTAGKTPTEVEYDVKAAFIYNFMKFVEWPPEKKAAQDRRQPAGTIAPMTIGILGDNPFGDSFQPIIGKVIQDRTLRVIEIPSLRAVQRRTSDNEKALAAYQDQYQDMIDQCEILFICASEKDVSQTLLAFVHGKAVLTVSDLPAFAETGGMIGFVEDRKKVRFEINLDASTRERIDIRSQLLGLARKIYQSKK